LELYQQQLPSQLAEAKEEKKEDSEEEGDHDHMGLFE